MLFLSIVPAPYHLDDLEAKVGSALESILITEFYAAGLRDDEYIVLSNPSSTPVNLRNWSMTDGEGSIVFLVDEWLAPGSSLVVTMNSSSYEAVYGRAADCSLSDSAAAGSMEMKGRFRLADAGDSLSIRSPDGSELDFVVYGNCSERSTQWIGPPTMAPRSGEVAKRALLMDAWCETNSASDWLWFREFRYGYTTYDPFEFTVPAGAVTAFVSPDCSLPVVLDSIRAARTSIELCSYEIDSAPVCSALADSLARGVSVALLVDGAPAGGISEKESASLSFLGAAGASVRLLNGNISADNVQHVGALHCKYMVIDSHRSVVISENFVEDGLPSDTVCGNRGWGIAIDSAEVASFLGRLFDDDSRRSRHDVTEWSSNERYDPRARLQPASPPNHTVPALLPMVSTSEAKVSVVVSPDDSPARPFILDWIEVAGSMLAEQFQVDLSWESRSGEVSTSPIISALADSIHQGARLRVLFDSSWFNAERNRAVADYLQGLTPDGGVEVTRMLDEDSPLSLLHNKGAVFDGTVAMVSSNNWVCASFAKNRELAAFVDSPEIAAYFTRAFEFDWEPDVIPPDASAGEDICVPVGQMVRLNASDSVDDRAIVHWLWDLASDGTYDGDEEMFEFRAVKAEEVQVDLIVEDAWGNRAWDSVTVTIVAPGSGDASKYAWVPPPLLVAASVSAGLIAGCAIARSRARSARKINQSKPD